MPALHEFTEQEILSRCFMASVNRLAVGGMDGDGGIDLQSQEVLNRAFVSGDRGDERIR